MPKHTLHCCCKKEHWTNNLKVLYIVNTWYTLLQDILILSFNKNSYMRIKLNLNLMSILFSFYLAYNYHDFWAYGHLWFLWLALVLDCFPQRSQVWMYPVMWWASTWSIKLHFFLVINWQVMHCHMFPFSVLCCWIIVLITLSKLWSKMDQRKIKFAPSILRSL